MNGDGDDKPRGFLDYDLVAESSYVWGKIGYVATGVDGAFASSDPVDKVIDLIYTPKAQFRQNARFVMNRKTVSSVRKLKDGDGHYVWEPNDAGGSTLLGYPITEIEDMPDIATDSFSIAFGAVMLGLARHFARPGNRPERTLAFIVSAGHHTPGINGPRAFIAAITALA